MLSEKTCNTIKVLGNAPVLCVMEFCHTVRYYNLLRVSKVVFGPCSDRRDSRKYH